MSQLGTALQDAATKAEKEADPTAKRVTDAAGDAAHDAAKSTRDKWEEVKPEEKVDRAAKQAKDSVQVRDVCLSASFPRLGSKVLRKLSSDAGILA